MNIKKANSVIIDNMEIIGKDEDGLYIARPNLDQVNDHYVCLWLKRKENVDNLPLLVKELNIYEIDGLEGLDSKDFSDLMQAQFVKSLEFCPKCNLAFDLADLKPKHYTIGNSKIGFFSVCYRCYGGVA